MTKDIIYNNKTTNYTLSDDGTVINKNTGKVLKHIKIDRNHRYECVKLCINGISHVIGLHRLLMITFCPVDDMENLEVNHIDGDKTNNDLSNLEWVTPSENVLHAFKYNLRQPMRGGRNGNSKLTRNIVINICNDIMENNLTEYELSKKYEVSPSLIHSIKHKKVWKEITDRYDFPKQIEGNAKLNEDNVREICQCILDGMTNKQISEIYNVSPYCIKDIKGKRTWRYITKEYF